MEKQLKKEKKLAERRAKKLEKRGIQKELKSENTNDISQPLTLEDITNPNKG